MGFFYLIEQNHRVGLAANLFGQHATFFVTHVSWRRSHQSAHSKFLHELTHINPNHGIVCIKQKLAQRFGQLRFSYTRWAQENEGTNGAIGLFKSCTRTLYGFGQLLNGLVLTNHPLAQSVCHGQQSPTLVFRHAFYGYARYHGNHRSDIVFGYHEFLIGRLRFPTCFSGFQIFQKAFLSVAQLRSLLKILAFHHFVLLNFDGLDLGFKIHNVCRNIDIADMHPCPRFIQNIDGFIGQMAITHVAHTQIHTGFNGLRRILHTVVIFVFIANIV